MSRSYLFADVFGIHLVHDVFEGYDVIHSLIAVHAVSHSYEANPICRKEFFYTVSHADIVSSQSGKVLYQNGPYTTFHDIRFEPIVIRAIEVCSRVSIVHIVFDVPQAKLFGFQGKHLLLISDGVTFAFVAVLSGEPTVKRSDFVFVFGFKFCLHYTPFLQTNCCTLYRFYSL